MEITPLFAEGRQVVQAYDAQGFTVAGEHYGGSIIVLPARTIRWNVEGFAQVTAGSFDDLLDIDPPPEVLVLGTGSNFHMIDPRLRQSLRQRGIVVECMATPAACRTFNVLLVEDRKVAAALIAPKG